MRDFTSAAAEPAVPGTVAVKLTPRKSDPEFEARSCMDPNTPQIRPDDPGPAGGQSTMTFTNLKENTGISDKGVCVPRPEAWMPLRMANVIKRAFTPVVLACLIAGCATTTALRNGKNAEQLQDYDRAIVEYTKALRSDPDNREARQLLERARVRAAADHFSRGRRFEAGGRLDEALVELQLAAELNPNSQGRP